MTEIATALGKNVRSQRMERGLTQEDLSELVGVHYTFLGHIERGSKLPSLPVLLKIAAALRIPAAALLRGVAARPHR